MPDSMPPPGEKPALAIAIGVPKKSADNGKQAPDDNKDQGGKMPVEEALVVRSDKHCNNCENYQPETGDCEKVEGSFDPDDACMRWFTPMGGAGHDEPDADEYGGASDNDADDMGAQQ